MNNFKKYTETKSFLVRVESGIKNSFTWDFDSPKFNEYAPKDLQEKIKEILLYIKQYDVEKLRPQAITPTGELFDFNVIKDGIQNSTGYIWRTREFTEENKKSYSFTSEGISTNFGVNPTEVKVFELERDSKSRGELWLLQVVLMPGCAFIGWDAGRSAGHTEIHNSIESLLEEFSEV